MIDRMFNWLDWSCDAFLKLVVIMLFGACGIYLAVAGGTFGLCIFLALISFLRWALSDPVVLGGHDEEI
ncbi:hypothetical protein [Kordiimonas sp.]|uniref:hypothetical protein n=1 Tax=Kordiimonas sp. TaxID=1970157 RepID=UPI003A8F360E